MSNLTPLLLISLDYSKGGETIGRFVTLFKPVSNWIVSPVGEDILHPKTGAVIGNRNTRMLYSIIIPCVLRFAFFPLLIFSVNPLYITSDIARIIIVLLFAVSSGWIYNCCFILTPELCRDREHKEAASLLIIIFNMLGLGIGSAVDLPMTDSVLSQSHA